MDPDDPNLTGNQAILFNSNQPQNQSEQIVFFKKNADQNANNNQRPTQSIQNLTNQHPKQNNEDEIKMDLEDQDEDDDDDDDNEPKLRYYRIHNDVPKIMKDELVTCMAIHEKFFILGTQSGKMFLLTINGEICSNGLKSVHRSSINQITIDERAEFISSCSDYRIAINELYSDATEPHYSATFDRPVKAFAIEPQYSTSSAKRFVVGEADRLLLYEKNLIGRYKFTPLQYARGVIRCISWRKDFIVWSSDLVMKIYDVPSRQIFSSLDREKESDYRVKLDLYQCSITWKDDRTFLLAWGNTIKGCVIKKYNYDSELSISTMVSVATNQLDRVKKYYVELIYSLNIGKDLIGCGVAPLEDRLLILCAKKSLLYPTIGEIGAGNDDDDDPNGEKLIKIKMVEPRNAEKFTEISDDILMPKNFLKTLQQSRDISIHYYSHENLYWILFPKDLLVAKPRSEDDSIDWLLNRGKFLEAFNRMRSNHKCKRHSYESVGQIYIKHLLEQNNLDSCDEARKICLELCEANPKLWSEQLNLFKQYSCLRVLIKHLPTGSANGVKLEPHLYEMILNEFLESDSQDFLQTIRLLPPNLYDTATMINHTTNKLSSRSQDNYLLEALAELNANERRYDKALFIFLQVGNAKKVFDLIWKHQLLHLLEDRIVELLKLDPEETSRLLIMNQDTIPADKVVSRLRKHPRLLCAYLDRLIFRDPTACSPYHDLLFDLYAKHEPNKIVPFLRQSNYIQLEKALDVCKKQNLTKAVVFILGRMGNTHEALRIIIDKMDDINAAIDFCKEHGDSDLWAELMDISVSKPQLLSTLLREVGTYAADPIGLIARIPEGLEVPDLVPSLVRILQDYRLMVTLEDGCRRVLNSDCYNLFKKLYRTRSRAVVVKDNERYCHSCQSNSANTNHGAIYAGGECILFQCGHLFHVGCLPQPSTDNNELKQQLNERLCIICQTKKKQSSPIIPSWTT